MTTLNPPMTPAVPAPAGKAPYARRRLPAGFGLGLAAVASLSLWAGLAHAVAALIA